MWHNRIAACQKLATHLYNKGKIKATDDVQVIKMSNATGFSIAVNGTNYGDCVYDSKRNMYCSIRPLGRDKSIKPKRVPYEKQRSVFTLMDYLRANKLRITR